MCSSDLASTWSARLRAFGTLDEITRSVRQVRNIEVLLSRADQVEAAARAIRPHLEPGLEVQAAPAELTVRFPTGKREEELAAVLAALVSAGIAVTQFREVQTDLEDAFMTVARQAEGEPGPAEPRPASAEPRRAVERPEGVTP